MAATNKLQVTLADGIKRITINRPERRNAVDTETPGKRKASFKGK